MARRRTHIPLDVYLNARLVGRLHRSAGGAIELRYDESWLDWEGALPVSLSLPLREERYSGDAVITVLDNLLPDDEAVRRRIAERVRAESHSVYDLLAKIGRDCVGALQFLPQGHEPDPADAVEGHRISDAEIARRIRSLAMTPLGLDEEEAFRISIAGMQEKTAFLHWKGEWHLPHGTTPTSHIMKPQIGVLPNGIDLAQSVENEYLCLRLASAFGLPSARTEILDFDGVRVLAIERFDRRWDPEGRLLRLPQEDCCQALSVPSSLKYDADGGPGMSDLLDLLKGSDSPSADRQLFLKAQVVFWLLGATDGHAKNFSIFLRPGSRFHMAPLYDVMSAQPAVDAGQIRKNQYKFAFAVGDNRHYVMGTILPRHFIQTARGSGMEAAVVETIFADVIESADRAIGEVLDSLPGDFPDGIAESIAQGLGERLEWLERTA
ncbi:MAG: type II toxin-antitoxin system HipA family toxin [Gammaproteobacteria bacterium]|nr:type II toxin-antitoxin system HipA family toxin [Gammaproteobacteria bacterium]MDE0302995.1 type II toxin-antitoxin system HipA family toxin [Gammaproteobacteria bacterium]